MNEKHGGFYDPQYRIYDTDRPQLPELAFYFDAANVLDDARTVSHAGKVSSECWDNSNFLGLNPRVRGYSHWRLQ